MQLRPRAGRPGRPPTLNLLAVLALLAPAPPAHAFDSKGHNVIEALAYRTLAEGRGTMPARPDVLRDLLNDGALEPPYCFGAPGSRTKACDEAALENPLLAWPRPRSDRADAFFRRQFSDPGQCFHYMATLGDAQSDPFPGTAIPGALATRAVVRCNDLLDDLLRQVVVDGGPGVRRSGSGLYELLHAVADSFSGAHTERAPNGDVDYLRVWKPIEKLVRLPTERSERIPAGVYHTWSDHRDKTYVREGEPDHCEARTDNPYDVTYECLSDEGDRARRALAELLVVVRDLRVAQLAAPAGIDTEPDRSAAWRAYRAEWFTPVHPCEGAECEERQPADAPPGSYSVLGLEYRRNPTAGYRELVAHGSVLKFTEAFNPFVYVVDGTLAYRHHDDGTDSGVAGLGMTLTLPVGFRAFVGFTPAELRVAFGGTHRGPEFVSRLLRFDWKVAERLHLSVDAPLEVSWLEPRADWSFAVGLSYSLSSARLAGGPILSPHHERADRHDEAWVPPPAPYGRLKGRRSSLHFVTGFTVNGTPDDAVEGQKYGVASLGVELTWDRDRWGGRYGFTPVAHLSVGMRSTSGESAYVTGMAGADVRWTFARPLGLSFTPVRVEAGPKVRRAAGRHPGEDEGRDPGRGHQGELERRHPAERVAGDVTACDSKLVEEEQRVGGQVGRGVRSRGRRALPRAPAVRGDHPEAPGERLDAAGPEVAVAAEPGEEEERRAVPGGDGGEADRGAGGLSVRHGGELRREGGSRPGP